MGGGGDGGLGDGGACAEPAFATSDVTAKVTVTNASAKMGRSIVEVLKCLGGEGGQRGRGERAP